MFAAVIGISAMTWIIIGMHADCEKSMHQKYEDTFSAGIISKPRLLQAAGGLSALGSVGTLFALTLLGCSFAGFFLFFY